MPKNYKTKYDELYRQTPHALGKPSQILVDFFNRLPNRDLSVLDMGCAQGRDAIFMARLGHRGSPLSLEASSL